MEELATIRPAWERLMSQAASASIFSTWEWLASWWRGFSPKMELLALGFFDARSLVGLALLQLDHRRIALAGRLRVVRLMGDGTNDSDHLDFPVVPGYEAEVAGSLLRHLRAHGKWDICEFNTLPASSAVGLSLRALAHRARWTHFAYRRPGCAVALPDSWATYLNQISKKEKHKLLYYMRRLEKKYEVTLSKCTAADDLPSWLEELFSLHRKRWTRRGEAGTFTLDARRRFYQEMAATFLARGWLEFWRLEVGNQTVASQFGFRYGDTVFALQEGLDPDYYRDGVGYVLRGRVLGELIGQGVRRYDFLAGESASKQRWGTQPSAYLDIHCARRFSIGAAYLAVVHSAGILKEWLRGGLPNPIWARLRRSYRALRPAPSPTIVPSLDRTSASE